MSRWIRLAWMPALIVLLSSEVKASSLYTITDLGTLPGTSGSIATGINDLGQVVGYAGSVAFSGHPGGYVYGPDTRSFLYSNGQLNQIDNPASNPVGGIPAGSINDSGQVVSVNQFINNSGQVVDRFAPLPVTVTTTTGGVTTSSQASFTPIGINDAGQMAGSIWNPDSTTPNDVGIYQNGKVFDISRALGLTGITLALAIDNAGNVLLQDYRPGISTVNMIYKPDGTTQVLPTFGTDMATMNKNGQVTLASNLVTNGSVTPLLDLIPPSSQIQWKGSLIPTAMNDEGQIVGFGYTASGAEHAFLMTPTTPTPAPEPSTLALLATAIGVASIREWVRRGRRRSS